MMRDSETFVVEPQYREPREAASEIAQELGQIEFPPPGVALVGAEATGSPRVFIDSLIDAIISAEPTAWPMILKALAAVAVLFPRLAPVVALLQNAPIDQLVAILKQVRNII